MLSPLRKGKWSQRSWSINNNKTQDVNGSITYRFPSVPSVYKGTGTWMKKREIEILKSPQDSIISSRQLDIDWFQHLTEMKTVSETYRCSKRHAHLQSQCLISHIKLGCCIYIGRSIPGICATSFKFPFHPLNIHIARLFQAFPLRVFSKPLPIIDHIYGLTWLYDASLVAWFRTLYVLFISRCRFMYRIGNSIFETTFWAHDPAPLCRLSPLSIHCWFVCVWNRLPA